MKRTNKWYDIAVGDLLELTSTYTFVVDGKFVCQNEYALVISVTKIKNVRRFSYIKNGKINSVTRSSQFISKSLVEYMKVQKIFRNGKFQCL